MRVQHCRSCNAEVVWAVTESGKRMPLDAQPTPSGNIILADDIAIVLRQGEPRLDNEDRYTSHFTTCPQANDWRGK